MLRYSLAQNIVYLSCLEYSGNVHVGGRPTWPWRLSNFVIINGVPLNIPIAYQTDGHAWSQKDEHHGNSATIRSITNARIARYLLLGFAITHSYQVI